MIFSKFRPLYLGKDCQIDTNKSARTLEILKNSELYAPNFTELNDTDEFRYQLSYNNEQNYKERIREVYDRKIKYRICSFSDFTNYSWDNTCCMDNDCFLHHQDLMWAHYANSFKGLRIDFSLNKGYMAHKVEYNNRHSNINIRQLNDIDNDFERFFLEVMLRKNKVWHYEQEYRILLRQDQSRKRGNKYFININIEKIIIGSGFLGVNYEVNPNNLPRNIENIKNHIKGILLNNINAQRFGRDIEILIYRSQNSNQLIRIDGVRF